ncbi:MAG: Fe-S-containing hydro-lyase [Firmicutes bacterium]|nr:Fe-S-containing hydro-lyase [Bacillota bacterium]
MAEVIKLQTPLTDEDVMKLKAGDIVSLSGVIYTGRDAAHKRLVECLDRNEPMPIDVKGQAIYYVGPAPAKPGKPIGSCGPTTSYRMDPYTPTMLAEGMKAMIGKGPRSKEVVDAMLEHKGVYLAAIGGAAAVIAKAVKSCEVITYEDLGAEAIHKLEVEDFICFVAIDAQGDNLYETGKLPYMHE